MKPMPNLFHVQSYDTGGYNANVIQGPRGDTLMVTTPHGRAGILASTAATEAVPVLGKLVAGLAALTTTVDIVAGETLPEKIASKLEKPVRDLGPAFRDGRYGTTVAKEKLDLETQAREIGLQNYDPALAAYALAEFSKLDHSKKIAAIQTWPAHAIFAIKRAGQELSGLSIEEWSMVNRRVRKLNEIMKIKENNPNFAQQPTPDQPTARGFDDAKIERFVTDQDNIHARRVEALEAADAILRNAVVFGAVALGISTQQVWEMWMGTKDV